MKPVKSLTAKEVAAITSHGVTAIGGVTGLCLNVVGNRRTYLLRFTSPSTGKRSTFTIGSVESMTLKEARERAREVARLVVAGTDPVGERRNARRAAKAERLRQEQMRRGATFAEVAREWLQFRIHHGYYDQNVRGPAIVRSYLERDINPKIGNLAIASITPKDVFDCVLPLWTTTTEAKNKVLAIISNVFRWCAAMEIADVTNPADRRGPLGVLLENLTPHAPRPRNHGALAAPQIPDFFAALIERKTMAARTLAFAILTASRSKPARTARWSEIDLERRVWVCPEESMKMKGRGAFVVYLSSAAVALLEAQPRYPGVDLVFPSPHRRAVITDAGIGQVIGDMHAESLSAGGNGWLDLVQTERYGEPVRATVHGFRASFKTWTRSDENLRRFHPDAVELCLAHKLDDGFDGAYDRATLEEERKRVMESWGEFCTSKTDGFEW